MIIAIIQPINAFTRPNPPPRIWRRISPAHVTREAYVKPVVARNDADDDAISAFTLI